MNLISQSSTLFKKTASETTLSSTAKTCAGILTSYPTLAHQTFCLWMHGAMGSGKTTFARHLLYALGTPSHIPVTSPTFTIACTYPSTFGNIAHLDLSRMPYAKDPLPVLGLELTDISGWIIEWPHISTDHPQLAPSHSLTIEHTREHSRQYILRTHSYK